MPNDLINAVERDNPNFGKVKINVLRKLLAALLRRRVVDISGAYDEHNDLVGAICTGITHGKARVFFAWQHSDADKLHPMTGILDRFIFNNSLKPISLQLADYDKIIPKETGEGLGASEFIYYHIHSRKKTLSSVLFRRYLT